ncbi:AraC family transcriptional regulator [Sphingobacterium sp. ML3W]|uniref:AraC family transcriptional regulator n=1 Tax=Sphingobacterium sp. ML3W TaxID=1538644 RepID=UPI00068B810D|nr:AraC family transcriptional regulator [Sphingobacterium sp. ML3W]
MINNVKYRPIEAYLLSAENSFKDVSVNFFNFIYVISGSGDHYYNGNAYAFKAGYFMVSTPDKGHQFKMTERVEFLIMQFHINTIIHYPWKSIKDLDRLLFNSSQTSGKINFSENDSQLVIFFVNGLISNLKDKSLYYRELNMSYIDSLIFIVARSLSSMKPAGFSENTENKIEDVLNYIEENIHYPKKLTIQQICSSLQITPNYFSTYFKKNCGINFQKYINDYRLRLIEHRLKYSDKRVGEIAEEFGFVDESHINKFFKKQRGMNMSSFKMLLFKNK